MPPMPNLLSEQALQERLSRIRWLFLDVDGVLTDGHLVYSGGGEATKTFHVLDGHGITVLRRAGVGIGLLSGREHSATRRRAQDLRLDPVFLGVSDKLGCLKAWATSQGLELDEIAHMGDDMPDLPVLEAVGLAATVSTAVDEILAVSHWVARRPAGAGAVRDLCDLIFRALPEAQKGLGTAHLA